MGKNNQTKKERMNEKNKNIVFRQQKKKKDKEENEAC